MRILFMGTPDIAKGCLETLIKENQNIIGVVSQPDKRSGRGNHMHFPPVKELAVEYNIPVYQPEKARDISFIEEIKELNPDIILVVAYGQILPKEILDIPKYGCINLHVSLLPKLRGAAPINWCIINGDKKTGITTMLMDEGLDTGDILIQEEFELDNEITAGELHDIMMEKGGLLLIKTIEELKNGTLVPTPQNHKEMTYAPMMDKQMGEINFEKTSEEIHNLVRGVNPWPSAYTHWNEKVMKVWKTEIIEKTTNKMPGTVLKIDKNGIQVATINGIILIKEIQMQGKKRMSVEDFIKGNHISIGTILGK